MIYEISISNESPESSYTCFQNALKNDRIDFFFLGDFNEVEITESLKSLPFTVKRERRHYPVLSILFECSTRRNGSEECWGNLF